ncbi:hypothetical protein F5Y12DRAFT_758703 [Xylaria sp. FL1777]|nr:hypothetical protein F5Y12DRAFT_758703 [Xylaria sp. FL1777]
MMANFDDIPAGTPAAPPPPGVVPNLDDPVSRGPSFLILGVFVSLSLLSVLIRIFVRFRLTKGWGWDDYACIAAAGGSLTYAILYSEVISRDPVKHIWDIGISSIPDAFEAKGLSVHGVAYQITIFFTKLSILLLYLRIFGVNKIFSLITRISIVIITGFYIPLVGIAIGFLVSCNNLANFVESHFCGNYNGPVLLLNASFNVITDLWLLLLPFPVLLKLRLYRRQKIGLIAVFAAGVGACVASISRLVEISINYSNSDATWSVGTLAEFSIVEINIGIIVACHSTFPPFLSHVRDLLWHARSSKLTRVRNQGSSVGQSS